VVKRIKLGLRSSKEGIVLTYFSLGPLFGKGLGGMCGVEVVLEVLVAWVKLWT
jgi:hypothetical protein